MKAAAFAKMPTVCITIKVVYWWICLTYWGIWDDFVMMFRCFIRLVDLHQRSCLLTKLTRWLAVVQSTVDRKEQEAKQCSSVYCRLFSMRWMVLEYLQTAFSERRSTGLKLALLNIWRHVHLNLLICEHVLTFRKKQHHSYFTSIR